MEFRISDTFTSSLSKLTADEQKATKTTAFDLQMNPAHPGLRFHKLDNAKDPNFWSVRVSGDIRLIVHKTAKDILLCYVDHHDKAYSWAERRKLETHPKTGAAQMVVIEERHQEVVIPIFREQEQPARKKALPFASLTDDELLGYGVPKESLADVHAADERQHPRHRHGPSCRGGRSAAHNCDGWYSATSRDCCERGSVRASRCAAAFPRYHRC